MFKMIQERLLAKLQLTFLRFRQHSSKATGLEDINIPEEAFYYSDPFNRTLRDYLGDIDILEGSFRSDLKT